MLMFIAGELHIMIPHTALYMLNLLYFRNGKLADCPCQPWLFFLLILEK